MSFLSTKKKTLILFGQRSDRNANKLVSTHLPCVIPLQVWITFAALASLSISNVYRNRKIRATQKARERPRNHCNKTSENEEEEERCLVRLFGWCVVPKRAPTPALLCSVWSTKMAASEPKRGDPKCALFSVPTTTKKPGTL